MGKDTFIVILQKYIYINIRSLVFFNGNILYNKNISTSRTRNTEKQYNQESEKELKILLIKW